MIERRRQVDRRGTVLEELGPEFGRHDACRLLLGVGGDARRRHVDLVSCRRLVRRSDDGLFDLGLVDLIRFGVHIDVELVRRFGVTLLVGVVDLVLVCGLLVATAVRELDRFGIRARRVLWSGLRLDDVHRPGAELGEMTSLTPRDGVDIGVEIGVVGQRDGRLVGFDRLAVGGVHGRVFDDRGVVDHVLRGVDVCLRLFRRDDRRGCRVAQLTQLTPGQRRGARLVGCGHALLRYR
ncbi:hypothetical protein BWL13_01226 [Microbacterium oleivorans]|uniref:hypothetical protein n=1 Tax=Microbacterium oleivorans TaxID=273677 RepID=UPI000F8FA57A|nr:hypothetical protein [Microbacterium oleivorans]AZS43662.1 hypothetical protein BWL13_01226 [Microbacterium oleivorans]